ncbi:Glutathione S-transferase S1 [Modicella reniformis]|uniref:Glutathione S-transferase S1 n=1 Tax=Modicella reniformis TaxID=1440133 RepID=A0A9P6IJV5_9FUNG|nr:Glutathione S-transferase S1 [Modicella reniformis]
MNTTKLTFQSADDDASFTPQEKSRLLTETDIKDLTFKFLYWDIASVGSTARDLLFYAKAHYGAKYELLTLAFEDFASGKTPTAFSCVPMLKVVGPNNKEVDIAENVVIDMYLAERFNLMGDNKWESITIQAFYSNIQYLRERTFTTVMGVPEEKRLKSRQDFFQGTLKKFLENHAFHLQANGNNGHYIGNKLSLADIHLNNVIHYFWTVPWGRTVVEDHFKKCEPVWKVYETVQNDPVLAAWRKTDEFKAYETSSIKWYSTLGVPGEEPQHQID